MKQAEDLKQNEVQDNVVDFLSAVSLFDSFERDELFIIAEHMNLIGIEKDALLFSEGDKGNYVCFVLEGNLDVLKRTENDGHVKIATLSKGHSIGEMSILDQTFRSASIKACENSKVISLSFKDFEFILDNYPKVGVKVLKGLSRYLSLNMRRTSKQFADITENYMTLLDDYRKTF
jgi:CRP/FNR family transcriptional regulator, cyclic AMP receptor protein